MRLLMHSPWHNSRQETVGSSTDTQNKIRYKLDNKNFLRAAEDGTRIQQYHSSAEGPHPPPATVLCPAAIINNDLFTFSLCTERVAVIVSGNYTLVLVTSGVYVGLWK